MAQRKPYNSWAGTRPVAPANDTAKAKRRAEVDAIAAWAKGKGDLPTKDAK
ncbi:hypothetical protein KAR50_04305 [Periweissella fabaria]|uniref:Uncharacterized protein n=3 Tax=Periweissella TaxID=2930384 RepID=A0A7X6N196_9LACO|nr:MULTISPECIES: hypothetical protein [Periweissella]MCM0597066.1 hypothetical protein [Periweissella fabaria]MCM0598411.1 hypothetical protein [Periweissella fabalis]MCM0601249.1 hypothetical protein [Periweissella ghanensis]NKZ23966.1 hypothetical protein [Periweissella fabalis]CAH0417021.1 hypothetical protein WFA24289_01338 [Periweissella fabaria]